MNLIIIILVSVALFQMLYGARKIEYHTVKWLFILSFLGYRAIDIESGLNIHPLEVILWVYLAIGRTRADVPILFYVFFVLAIIIALFNNVNFFNFLKEYKTILLIIPAFKLAAHYLRSGIDLNQGLKFLLVGLTLASSLGLIEYYFPGLANALPGMQNAREVNELLDFKRARFSHWGTPTVGHVLIFSIPIALKFIFENYGNYIVNMSSLFLNLLAIYITGNRADWIVLIPMILVIYVSYNKHLQRSKRFNRNIPLIIMIGTSLFASSQVFYQRFLSGLVAISGTADKALDSSGYVRANRVENAWSSILNNPLGVGLGNTGWVHSDFLQITQAMGWLPGFTVFFFFVGLLFVRFIMLKTLYQKPSQHNDLLFLISCNIAAVFQFTVNGIYGVPQTGVYYFLFSGLLYYYFKYSRNKS